MMTDAPDCLIFDVDGVLIEGTLSWPSMIAQVIEEEWQNEGLVADAPGYDLNINRVLKRQGAFNDDYDIAWTLLNIAYSRRRRALSEALPTPEELREIISTCGHDCASWMRANFPEHFDREKILLHCEEAYFGDERETGAWRLERPLLRSHWRRLSLESYIYTGRNNREWALGSRTLGWEDMPPERVVNKDSGVTKPSAEGLARISQRFGHSKPLFFGDTESDVRSWREFGQGFFVGIGTVIDFQPCYANIEEALYDLLGWGDKTTWTTLQD